MRIERTKVSVSTLLIGALTLIGIAGCGGRAYELLAKRRLDRLRSGAPFKILYGPKQIGESPFSVRIPLAFRKSYTPESEHKNDRGTIRPDRLQPPFWPLPGLTVCYEGTWKDGSDNLPFYCYVAVEPHGNADRVREEAQKALKAVFPDTPDEWQTVDAKSPDDKAVQWKMIRVEGEQPFLVGNPAQPRNLPGIFELWIHEAQDDIILVGWRTPKSIETKSAPPTELDRIRLLTTEFPPDFSSMPALTAGTLTQERAAEDAG